MIQIKSVVPSATGATVYFTLDKPAQVRATYARTWAEFTTPWTTFSAGARQIEIQSLDPGYEYRTYLTENDGAGIRFTSQITFSTPLTPPPPPVPPPPQASLSIKDVTFDSATATISGLSPATKYTVQVAGTSSEFTTPAKQPPILPPNGYGPLYDFMKPLETAGLLAGNVGDSYANRDNRHAMYTNPLPQVTVMPPQNGIAVQTFPGVVLGNASLADGKIGGSLQFQMQAKYAQQAYSQYRANNLFFYPAHVDIRDNEWPSGETGTDHFQANWPYTMATLNSSGEELDEVQKFFYVLACFRPETKRRLIETGTLMPTLQMVYRWTRGGAAKYLTGEAHPSAFGDCDNTRAMCEMAQAMRPEDIPPVAKLKVSSETFAVGERLFDTPCTIARRMSVDGSRVITVDAVGEDVNGRTGRFEWRVLRGSNSVALSQSIPSRLVIQLSRPGKQLAPGATLGKQVWSQRVDVGLFVHNGVYWSSPAFVTVWGG